MRGIECCIYGMCVYLFPTHVRWLSRRRRHSRTDFWTATIAAHHTRGANSIYLFREWKIRARVYTHTYSHAQTHTHPHTHTRRAIREPSLYPSAIGFLFYFEIKKKDTRAKSLGPVKSYFNGTYFFFLYIHIYQQPFFYFLFHFFSFSRIRTDPIRRYTYIFVLY